MLHSCDVTILGAGVIGCAIARALSRFDCSFAAPERAEDVCCGIFKANKCHHPRAGSDAPAGSLKTRLNGRGNARMDQLAAAPDVPPASGYTAAPSPAICITQLSSSMPPVYLETFCTTESAKKRSASFCSAERTACSAGTTANFFHARSSSRPMRLPPARALSLPQMPHSGSNDFPCQKRRRTHKHPTSLFDKSWNCVLSRQCAIPPCAGSARSCPSPFRCWAWSLHRRGGYVQAPKMQCRGSFRPAPFPE